MPKKREKLDDKIKALDSTRVFKKITPKGDLSWYVKWTASVIILWGMVLTSIGGLEPGNLVLHFIGVIGWLVVGLLWHDRALIFINTAAAVIFGTGILRIILENYNGV